MPLFRSGFSDSTFDMLSARLRDRVTAFINLSYTRSYDDQLLLLPNWNLSSDPSLPLRLWTIMSSRSDSCEVFHLLLVDDLQDWRCAVVVVVIVVIVVVVVVVVAD